MLYNNLKFPMSLFMKYKSFAYFMSGSILPIFQPLLEVVDLLITPCTQAE